MSPGISEGFLYFLKFPLLGLICAFVGCSLWIIYQGLPDEKLHHPHKGGKTDGSSDISRSLTSEVVIQSISHEGGHAESSIKHKTQEPTASNSVGRLRALSSASEAVSAERSAAKITESPALDMHNALTDPDLPAVGMRRLEVVSSPCINAQFLPLKNSLTFGRSKECDVRLDDTFVSRRHAQLLLEPDGDILLQDLNSGNGTFWNGTLLTVSVYLKDGDTFSIGNSTFRYRQS
ncbi:MAG: FHA domain-containing protein [Candidatus Bruticola sp.]